MVKASRFRDFFVWRRKWFRRSAELFRRDVDARHIGGPKRKSGSAQPARPGFTASTLVTSVYTTPNTMAQTNAIAAYAAATLSLAAKSMGTAPLLFDVDALVLKALAQRYQNGNGLKDRAAVHPHQNA